MSGIVVLLLMKKAYQKLLLVKKTLSVRNIIESYQDSQIITSSTSYKPLESRLFSPFSPRKQRRIPCSHVSVKF